MTDAAAGTPAARRAVVPPRVVGAALRRLRDLAVLLAALSLLLFVLLRIAGDPAAVLGGQEATAEQLAGLRASLGLDEPVWLQYLNYLGQLARFDFGHSLTGGQEALGLVLAHLPVTVSLVLVAMALSAALAIAIGAWLGLHPERPSRRLAAGLLFLLQGTPGFVTGLLLIRLLSVDLGWLPSVGYGGPANLVLPVLTLAGFLVPKLARVVAVNVGEAVAEDYVRTARANGAGTLRILWSHVLPNALLSTAALVGTMLASLLAGTVVTETLFARPGIGWLLLKSTETLDFPVLQTLALVTAVLVFMVNAATDLLFVLLDPRLRQQR
ncbi:ABC transporter permease [Zavarzinia compransoris]|uniref:Glutathione ABC transporter permease GsiC n=1 Tax=Zavarzinia compransoris TaxID=1264899 RepID=A0A317DYZ8_9PROT|nr:ABC transporter permease [Zavarzinia compransoris]PWR18263.1 glutathione ABC transporter permease GsiC [Zavarzinia compransoris]TDP43681.1 peptide/nickel transport system permease protein [Zavarzinia compransoris]